MSSIEVRPFRRRDGEQLTGLVNAHAGAVVRGMSVSVNTVMSQLEAEPGEFIVGPWVTERATLVAEQRRRVVAAVHLLRYGAGDEVGKSYRDAGELRWFLFWPEAPYWPDSAEAGEALMAACITQLHGWGVGRQYADGALPVPGVYGVPEQWPHIRTVYERAGFVPARTEIVYVAAVDELPRPAEPPVKGLSLHRSLGVNGTRLSAALGDDVVGYIEVDMREDAGRVPRHPGWADVGNLHVAEQYRRRGVATWLVGQAADWFAAGAGRPTARIRVSRSGGLHRVCRRGWLSRAHAHEARVGANAAASPFVTGRVRVLRTKRVGRPLVIGSRDPEDHPVATRSRARRRGGRDVDVRLPEPRHGVGDRSHTIVALDHKRPLRLAERHAGLLGGGSQRFRVLRDEIELRLPAGERESKEGKQVHAAFF
jgi:GNAT superfamily N-acetyltransferase